MWGSSDVVQFELLSMIWVYINKYTKLFPTWKRLHSNSSMPTHANCEPTKQVIRVFYQSCLFLWALQYFMPLPNPFTAFIYLPSEISVTGHVPSYPESGLTYDCSQHLTWEQERHLHSGKSIPLLFLFNALPYPFAPLIHLVLDLSQCIWCFFFDVTIVFHSYQASIVGTAGIYASRYAVGFLILFHSADLWPCKMKRMMPCLSTCLCFREEQCYKRTRLVCDNYPGLSPIIMTVLCFGEIVSVCISG